MKARSAFTVGFWGTGVWLLALLLAASANRVNVQSFRGLDSRRGARRARTARRFNFATAAFPQNSDNVAAEKGPSTFDTRHRWTTAINYRVPALRSLPNPLAAGWQLNTVITIQSGRPIPIINSNDTSGTFNFHQRPNVVPGVNPFLPNWSPATGYLNPLAFAQPADGTFGNLGRDQIYGPGFVNFDFSVTKNIPIREQYTLQFRAEFFNIFNHPNFALPSNVITPGVNADGTINTTAGPAGVITQTPDVAGKPRPRWRWSPRNAIRVALPVLAPFAFCRVPAENRKRLPERGLPCLKR